MEQERCYVCRRLIPEGQVFRRVMSTAHYTGGNLGTASGVFSFTRAEVVSLCAACDAAEARRAVWRPGWGLKAVTVMFVVTSSLVVPKLGAGGAIVKSASVLPVLKTAILPPSVPQLRTCGSPT